MCELYELVPLCIQVRRPEVDIMCLPLSLFTFFLEISSLTEPGTSCFGLMGRSVNPQDHQLPTLILVTGGIRVVCLYSWIFMSVLSIRTRNSGLHSMNYLLIHLPGLHLFFRLLLHVTKSDEEDLGQK